MDYEIVKRISIDKSRCTKIGPYLYDKIKDAIYWEGAYPFPVQIMLSDGLSKCQVTPFFTKLPYFLRAGIQLDLLMREIDLMKLVLTGSLMLHASCVDHTLIVGYPNSGKTYQTYLLAKHGGKIVSEECTLIQKNKAFPYKKTIKSCFSARTIKDCGIKLNFKERLNLWYNTVRAKLVPFIFEAVTWKTMEVSGEGSRVRKIIYGSTGEEMKDPRQLMILTDNEFPFAANEMLQAYALTSGLDIIDIQKRQRKLIKDFIYDIYPCPGK
jgi:hypothetical protein